MKKAGSIFSLGYQQRTLAEFIAKLCAANINVVIDVRETPWSRKRGFSKKELESGLNSNGIEYIHAKFAGNPKEIRRNASSYEECLLEYSNYLESRPSIVEQLDSLLDSLLSQGQNVCLICYERHPSDCHRSVLLDHWLKITDGESDVVHLDPNGTPRFIQPQIDFAAPSSE